MSITPIPMKIPVKISRFLIIPIFLIKTKQEIFIKIDEEPIWSGLPGQFQPVFTYNPTVFILTLFVSCFLNSTFVLYYISLSCAATCETKNLICRINFLLIPRIDKIRVHSVPLRRYFTKYNLNNN